MTNQLPPFQPGGDALRHWSSEWARTLRKKETNNG